jgi:hypothetical protein
MSSDSAPISGHLGARFVRFWRDEASLSVLLMLLIGSELVLPAVAPNRPAHDPITGILFSCVLLAGAGTVWSRKRWLVRAVMVLCIVAAVVWWVGWSDPGGAAAAFQPAMTVIILALLALLVLSSVLRAGSVTRRQIQGAIAAYLLLGLAWASAYEWIALRDPRAFSGGDGPMQWTYYSLVTLTTMGYGDITPIAPVAQSLAVAEAITGQMYIAILISRLVALSLARDSRHE